MPVRIAGADVPLERPDVCHVADGFRITLEHCAAGIAGRRDELRIERDGDLTKILFQRCANDLHILKSDERERDFFFSCFPRLNRTVEGRVNIIAQQRLEDAPVASGECNYDHLVSVPRALNKMVYIESAISESDVKKSALRWPSIIGCLCAWRSSIRKQDNLVARLIARLFFCARHRLKAVLRRALVSRPAAKHRVKPEQYDAGDHGEDKNVKQLRIRHCCQNPIFRGHLQRITNDTSPRYHTGPAQAHPRRARSENWDFGGP